MHALYLLVISPKSYHAAVMETKESGGAGALLGLHEQPRVILRYMEFLPESSPLTNDYGQLDLGNFGEGIEWASDSWIWVQNHHQ